MQFRFRNERNCERRTAQVAGKLLNFKCRAVKLFIIIFNAVSNIEFRASSIWSYGVRIMGSVARLGNREPPVDDGFRFFGILFRNFRVRNFMVETKGNCGDAWNSRLPSENLKTDAPHENKGIHEMMHRNDTYTHDVADMQYNGQRETVAAQH